MHPYGNRVAGDAVSRSCHLDEAGDGRPVPVQPAAMAAGVGAVQTVKSGMPPGLWRFQVPPQSAPPFGVTSTRFRFVLP